MEFLVYHSYIPVYISKEKEWHLVLAGQVLEMEGKQMLALGGNPDKEAGYSHGLKVYPASRSLDAGGNTGELRPTPWLSDHNERDHKGQMKKWHLRATSAISMSAENAQTVFNLEETPGSLWKRGEVFFKNVNGIKDEGYKNVLDWMGLKGHDNWMVYLTLKWVLYRKEKTL